MENLEIVYLRTDELLPYARNARKHTVKQVGQIAASIIEFGFLNPVIIDKNKTIVAGHGRVMAAQQIGLEKIPVVRAEHLTDAQRRAYTLVDNQLALNSSYDDELLKIEISELKDFDFDLDLLGFDNLDELISESPCSTEGNTDPDEIPVVPKNIHGVQRGDIWQLGEHRLMCGDSTSKDDVLELMGDLKAELCFTSPPYADQREYNGGKDLSTEHLSTFLNAAESSCDLFAVNLGMSRKDNEINQYWDDYILSAKKSGMKFLSWNVWDKDLAGSVSNQTAMFSITHEWVLIFGKHKKLNRIYKNDIEGNAKRRRYDPGNIKGKAQRLVRQADGTTKNSNIGAAFSEKQMSTVLVCTPVMARNVDHPAQFPCELAETYILGCSSENASIYEPFCGSGSTLIACEKTGRKCVGMEIDEHYCSVIIERWQNFTGKTASKLNA